MSLRPRRLPLPPPSGDPRVDQWMNEVASAFNALPLSVFSTSDGPNESRVTAPQGFLGIEIGSSDTRFWVKESGSTSTGWASLTTGDNVRAYAEIYYP